MDDTLVIVTDSEVPENIFSQLSDLPIDCIILVGGNPHLAHGIMRKASILVSANSQFSFTAAMLNKKHALTIFPRKYTEGRDLDVNTFFDRISNFQVLN